MSRLFYFLILLAAPALAETMNFSGAVKAGGGKVLTVSETFVSWTTNYSVLSSNGVITAQLPNFASATFDRGPVSVVIVDMSSNLVDWVTARPSPNPTFIRFKPGVSMLGTPYISNVVVRSWSNPLTIGMTNDMTQQILLVRPPLLDTEATTKGYVDTLHSDLSAWSDFPAKKIVNMNEKPLAIDSQWQLISDKSDTNVSAMNITFLGRSILRFYSGAQFADVASISMATNGTITITVPTNSVVAGVATAEYTPSLTLPEWLLVLDVTNTLSGTNYVLTFPKPAPQAYIRVRTAGGTVSAALTGNLSVSGTISGDGSGLTNLSGSVSLPSGILTNNAASATLGGVMLSDGVVTGNGAGLTNLQSTNITGKFPDTAITGRALTNLSAPQLRSLSIANQAGSVIYLSPTNVLFLGTNTMFFDITNTATGNALSYNAGRLQVHGSGAMLTVTGATAQANIAGVVLTNSTITASAFSGSVNATNIFGTLSSGNLPDGAITTTVVVDTSVSNQNFTVTNTICVIKSGAAYALNIVANNSTNVIYGDNVWIEARKVGTNYWLKY